MTEFSSVLSIKVRPGKLKAPERNEVMRQFNVMTAHSFEVLPVLREHLQIAAIFANRHQLSLRGGDALHLAICEAHRVTIGTLDQRMHDAAIALGIGALVPA
jgi:predicted nucleic acid-binding protein